MYCIVLHGALHLFEKDYIQEALTFLELRQATVREKEAQRHLKESLDRPLIISHSSVCSFARASFYSRCLYLCAETPVTRCRLTRHLIHDSNLIPSGTSSFFILRIFFFFLVRLRPLCGSLQSTHLDDGLLSITPAPAQAPT